MSYYRGPRGFKPTAYGGQSQRAKTQQKSRQSRRKRATYQKRQSAYVMPAEKKGMDTDQGAIVGTVLSTLNTNAGIVVCNLIQAGTGSFNRIGRKSHGLSLRLWGVLQCFHASEATTGNYIANTLRQVVVWDKQPTGTLPTFDSIFGVTDQGGTESTTFMDPLKYDNMDRFQILRDVKYDSEVMAQPNPDGTEKRLHNNFEYDIFINLGGRESVYSGNSSPMTISDISSGALYIIYRATGGTTVTQWNLSSNNNCRLRYND